MAYPRGALTAYTTLANRQVPAPVPGKKCLWGRTSTQQIRAEQNALVCMFRLEKLDYMVHPAYTRSVFATSVEPASHGFAHGKEKVAGYLLVTYE